jgi:hypothetical protein
MEKRLTYKCRIKNDDTGVERYTVTIEDKALAVEA